MADGQGGGDGSYSAYGWGQSLSDMLGGYLGETGKIREENERKNQQQLQIEQTALQHLMTADDPGVKAAAITAWLAPRKSGPGALAKWYGQQEAHPIFQQVQQMLGSAGKPASQWWQSPGEKEAAAIQGKLRGLAQSHYETTGQWPDDDLVQHWESSLSGGPPRVVTAQHGTFFYGDKAEGQPDFEEGSFDPGTKLYYDRFGKPVTRAGRFVPGGMERPGTTGARPFYLPGRNQMQWRSPEGTIGEPFDVGAPPPGTYIDEQGNIRPLYFGGGTAPAGAAPTTPAPTGTPTGAPTPTLAGANAKLAQVRATLNELDKLDNDIQQAAARGIVPTTAAKLPQKLDQVTPTLSGGRFRRYQELQNEKNRLQQQLGAPAAPGAPGAPTAPQTPPAPMATAPDAGAPATPPRQLGEPGAIDVERLRALIREFQRGERRLTPPQY